MFDALKRVLDAFSGTTSKTNLAVQMQSLTANDLLKAREELQLAETAVRICKRIGEKIVEEENVTDEHISVCAVKNCGCGGGR